MSSTGSPAHPLGAHMKPNSVRPLAGLLATVLICALVSAVPAHASPVDDYAGYEPQETCTSTPKPGTEFLLHWLLRQYHHTGIAGMLRACNSGGTSEHKDGRAFDWAVDAANPAQAAQVKRFLARIFAEDKAGNKDALARRMGIMYIIWSDHIYSSYRQFSKEDYEPCGHKAKSCSRTLRHRDHVHISLSYSGGAAQSTFYRTRGVRSIPVLKPRTLQLDPVDTAIVKITVPATGRTVTPGFKLTRGTAYRIVGDGLYRFGSGPRISDAACRWSSHGWTPSDTGLRVNGRSPWTSQCDDGHTRVATYTPTETDYLRVRIADDTPADNAGSVTFYILREDIPARSVAAHRAVSGPEPHAGRREGPPAKRLRKETVVVRAASARGALTERALRRNAKYRVVVTGFARSGTDVFDGSCVKYAGRYRPQHTLDLAKPTADHLSLFIQGVRVNLRVPGSKAACDRPHHRYVGVYSAVVRGKARVRVWDPYTYADNSGSLTVKLLKRA